MRKDVKSQHNKIKFGPVQEKIDIKKTSYNNYINLKKIAAIFIICLLTVSCCIKANAATNENNFTILDIEKLASNENKENNSKYDNISTEQEDDDEEVDIEEIEKEIIETAADAEELEVNSRIALIYDRASGRILYEKNGNKQTPMASTTKIMTAIVVLENANLKDVVTIDSKAASIGGSRLGLKKNDKITVNDLLYGLMLRSGNDAAVALATYVGGSIEGFAEMMNKKANEMGLINSHFVVPHGLDNNGHFTTAYELAKMADYALNIDKFKQIVGTQSTTIYINGYAKAINNTNKLLGSISGVYGVKTGFTNGAGRCLVTSCKRDDLDIITVIIGADTTKQRTADSIKLINYVFENFEMVNIKETIEEKFNQWQAINQSRIYVNKGMENQVKLYLEEFPCDTMAVKKDKIDNIDIEVNSIFYLEAPVEEGKIIASVKVLLGDEVIEVLDVYNKIEIRKKGIKDYLIEFIKLKELDD